MENAYGIGVRNRYDLFYNDDVDPFEILKQQEEEKERRKTEKSLPKEKSKSIKTTGKTAPVAVPPKKGKDVAPASVPKAAEVTEPPSKPRNRTFGDRPKPPAEEPRENEERKNVRSRDDQPQNNEQRERPEGDFGRGGYNRGRGGGFRGRGRGGGRGRGMYSNFDGGKRRDFDRQSGSDKTGIRSVDKREGAGSNNWGNVKDECNANFSNTWDDDIKHDTSAMSEKNADTSLEEVSDGFQNSVIPEESIAVTSGDETTAENNTESKENVPLVEETTEEIDESKREMTLDEYKREQEGKRTVPKFNLRKPGEGEDGTQWKKLYMLKKKAKEGDEDEDEEEEDEDEEFGRRGRHRQLVDIQINFSDSRRGRGRGRGGRGTGPRGGGGGGEGGGGGRERGPPRDREDRHRDVGSGNMGPGRMNRGPPKMGKSSQQSAPRMDNWEEFPSLVTA